MSQYKVNTDNMSDVLRSFIKCTEYSEYYGFFSESIYKGKNPGDMKISNGLHKTICTDGYTNNYLFGYSVDSLTASSDNFLKNPSNFSNGNEDEDEDDDDWDDDDDDFEVEYNLVEGIRKEMKKSKSNLSSILFRKQPMIQISSKCREEDLQNYLSLLDFYLVQLSMIGVEISYQVLRPNSEKKILATSILGYGAYKSFKGNGEETLFRKTQDNLNIVFSFHNLGGKNDNNNHLTCLTYLRYVTQPAYTHIFADAYCLWENSHLDSKKRIFIDYLLYAHYLVDSMHGLPKFDEEGFASKYTEMKEKMHSLGVKFDVLESAPSDPVVHAAWYRPYYGLVGIETHEATLFKTLNLFSGVSSPCGPVTSKFVAYSKSVIPQNIKKLFIKYLKEESPLYGNWKKEQYEEFFNFLKDIENVKVIKEWGTGSFYRHQNTRLFSAADGYKLDLKMYGQLTKDLKEFSFLSLLKRKLALLKL